MPIAARRRPNGSAEPLGSRPTAKQPTTVSIRSAIAQWEAFYLKHFGLAVDLSKVNIPKAPAEFSRLIIVAQGVTLKDGRPLDEFFKARLRGIFVDQGIPTQDVDAVLARDFTNPVDARARALACAKISKEAREVFKRIANILDDARAKQIEFDMNVDTSPFKPVETELFNAFSREQVTTDYPQLIETLARIQPQVAAFFDKGGVMVMDPDPQLRRNRLSLLNAIYSRFAPIADFRLLAGAA